MGSSSAQFTVRYWGVRGSIPTPGPDTVRYGGNTTCIEIRADDQILIIDTGTGARRLGNKLMGAAGGKPLHLSLLYSHLHMDHIQGFPFFAPVYVPGNIVDIYSAQPAERTTRGVLTTQMSDPSFPVGLAALQSTLRFHHVERGASFDIGAVKISTCEILHPGKAMAIRVDFRGKSFVQCSDIEHTSPTPEPDLVELVRDADFFSFDSTYVEGEEYDRHKGWGHSTWQHGCRISDAANVGRFIAFHHDPSHNDDAMDVIAETMNAVRPGSLVAKEGMAIDMLTGNIVYNGTH